MGTTVSRMTNLRATVYCRISDDRAGAGLGIARQEQDCRALAEREGWEVVAVHVDNDLSAYSGRARPGYQALLDDVKAGTVDAIVAWHPDRLHRSPVDLEEFIALIDATGVQVRTVTAGTVDLSTASGRMTARVVGAVARHESEQKSERIRRKMRELAEAGKSNGGPRTFGYEPGHREVREAEAVLVREAARRALAGDSLTSIARDWNERGIPTVRGADGWTYQALRRMITSPRHAGLRSHRGRIVGEAEWPAIIDRDTYDQLVHRLRPGAAPVSRVRKRLLTGLAVCGRCGTRLYSKSTREGTPVYRCVRVPGRGQLTACGALSVVARPLDELVGGLVVELLSGPAVARALAGHADADTDRRALAEQLAVDEGRLETLAVDFADGLLGRGEWLAARDRITPRIEQTRRRLAEARDVGILAAVPTSQIAAWWDDAQIPARRTVVDAVIERVTVHPKGHRGGKTFDPGRATVTWRI